jgi:preprotein translocase subunit SecE
LRVQVLPDLPFFLKNIDVKREPMFRRFFTFLKNVKIELGYISWPTKADLKEGTTVVIIMSIVVGVFLSMVDGIFSFLIRNLLLKG